MDYIHACGGAKPAALLSRWPIAQTIDHAALRNCGIKALLEATVIDPQRREWVVGVVHLAARAFEEDEQRRLAELNVALDVFKPHRDARRPHLLAGDFNANAPYQHIDPQKCKPTTRRAWLANGGQVPRRVVQTLLDAGYLDSLLAVNPEHATHLGSFTTQFPGQRVDYIFSFGLDRPMILDAWIEHDRLAKYASDHFPVGADIRSDTTA
jgi:endonuclease/exonuclease/phosphatase family metal-dependent hydrolase